MVIGHWSLVISPKSEVEGWSLVSGHWSSRPKSEVEGWSLVSGQWSVVSGQWSLVSSHIRLDLNYIDRLTRTCRRKL